MNVPDMNRILVIAFLALFYTAALKAKFCFLEPRLKRFLEWVEIAAVPAEKNIMERRKFKMSRISL